MRQVFGAIAGALLTTSAYATEYRSVDDHMKFMGAGPAMMALTSEFSSNIRVYDPKTQSDILQRVFTAAMPKHPLADATRTPDMEADAICKVYATTHPDTAITELERFLRVKIEDRERFSGYELSFWFLFHELEHCGQKGAPHLRLSPERVRLETEADFNAIEKIRRANPKSNIAEIVVAFRSVQSTYANPFLLERRLRGEKTPDTAEALRSYMRFTQELFTMVPYILRQGLDKPEQEMARGIVLLKFMSDSRLMEDDNARSWAKQHLKGLRFFAPRLTASYERIADQMLVNMNDTHISARLRAP